MSKSVQKYSKNSGSLTLLEGGLREKVRSCYHCFPEEFLNVLDVRSEQEIKDIRPFTDRKNRRFDEMITAQWGGGSKRTVVIEYKRGLLTQEDVSLCVFERGYLELAGHHFPDFGSFIFVAEDIAKNAKVFMERITKNMSKESYIKLRGFTFSEYAHVVFSLFMDWAKGNHFCPDEAKKVALNLHLANPSWFSHDWICKNLMKIDQELVDF